MNTHVCPWCSYPLLRQVRFGKPQWWCLHCKQELPYSSDNTISNGDRVEEIFTRYKLLLENTYDIVLFAQQDGKITEANHAACQAYGYDRHELLSLKVQDLQTPENQTQLTEKRPEADSENIFCETKHRRKDGSTFPVEVSSGGMGIGEERIFISIIRDLTKPKQLETLVQRHIAREQLIQATQESLYKSLNFKEILKATVTEVQKFLKADRVIIHHFLPNGDSSIIVEAVVPSCPSMLGFMIHDPFLLENNYIQHYQQGESHDTADIYTSGLDRRLANLLAFFQVKSRLAVPILQNTSYRNSSSYSENINADPQIPQQLWGLLIAHQCSENRQWQQVEIDALKAVTTQLAIAIQQSELYEQLQEAQQKLQQLSSVDSLTLLSNYSYFDSQLKSEWQQMAENNEPLSLILCNIDFFKKYNENYGSQAGDRCLQQIAKTLRSIANHPRDLVARYNGGELALLLPHRTHESALQFAEEIRFRVKALEIPHAYSPLSKYLTISLGVASTIPDPHSDPTQLIADAAFALNQAKEIRRNNNSRSLSPLTLLKPQLHQLIQSSNVTSIHQQQPEEAATHQDLLMSYVAYYVSRGKTVISPLKGSLPFTGLVYEYWGYHSDFQLFWKHLQQQRDFRQLYLEGDDNCFDHFLGGWCGVGECARCNLPIPIAEGSAYTIPNCTLCKSELIWKKQVKDSRGETVDEEGKKTKILAIGTPPANDRNLKKLFLLNGFEVTFARQPEEIIPELLPRGIELVLIYAEVSEAQGKAWAKQLRSYRQLEGVPIVALSPKAGFKHPWVKRELGVEDYILAPLGGDRLANHLRRIEELQQMAETATLHWFPS